MRRILLFGERLSSINYINHGRCGDNEWIDKDAPAWARAETASRAAAGTTPPTAVCCRAHPHAPLAFRGSHVNCASVPIPFPRYLPLNFLRISRSRLFNLRHLYPQKSALFTTQLPPRPPTAMARHEISRKARGSIQPSPIIQPPTSGTSTSRARTASGSGPLNEGGRCPTTSE